MGQGRARRPAGARSRGRGASAPAGKPRPATGATAEGYPPVIGESPVVRRLIEQVEAAALSDASVLITGETGTGKELVARMLHEKSGRRMRPFVPVSAAAFPETLIEAELFGHVRGAFTGAITDSHGRFWAADRGTLFLDEIAEIPLPVQAKLLRVIETGAFEPLGTHKSQRVDVRLVSATHRNLKEYVRQGLFREDLYYRLNVVHLVVPPLRERGQDLQRLVEYHLSVYTPPGTHPVISPGARVAITTYGFPGNVRELKHALQHALVLSRGGEIRPEHLPPEVSGSTGASAEPDGTELPTLADALRAFERNYLVRALRVAGGRKALAAKLMGIARKSVWAKLRRYGISPSEYAPTPGDPRGR